MTVIARSKIGAGRMRGATAKGDWGGLRSAVGASRSSKPHPRDDRATGHAAAERRREAGAPQDQAVYSCGCGFVFEAQVSTSVGCPHCGGTQAW